jgi:hypothetical protein
MNSELLPHVANIALLVKLDDFEVLQTGCRIDHLEGPPSQIRRPPSDFAILLLGGTPNTN